MVFSYVRKQTLLCAIACLCMCHCLAHKRCLPTVLVMSKHAGQQVAAVSSNKTICLANMTQQAMISHQAKLQVPALEGQGAPDVESHANIPLAQLPHDPQGHLLRPGVVWCADCVTLCVCLRPLWLLPLAFVHCIDALGRAEHDLHVR